MPDLTQLNSTTLQAFIDSELVPFYNRLVQLRAPGQNPPSLFDIGSMPQPLVLGQMNGDSDTSGETVLSNTVTAANAIDKVLNKHVSAFRDLELELEEVIRKFLKTQDDNLSDVTAQKFMSAIDDYVAQMDGGTGGGNPASGSGN
ncbi:type VII secretion system-associated protein [Streptomyces sp. NPDC093252]|uniref:type VII secretion system-associated protein n=1 Tax=Streptomyces sp. NPDC093252 TaxID=3154980 RepID=UPI003429C8CD